MECFVIFVMALKASFITFGVISTRADVIITFMSNDRYKHSDLMEIPFHALTYK
ncbi:hypothetical protein [Flavobacterium lacisediminis]|uniref:Uncharacterized protein n=1 Tax=Flavobacterium lacisediminis TaxID=2989705 RepID=A0ABT3EIY3_9FLAO|nr:hypothetical protein [Flavobacterium lacisediminis]MCW1148532.1 hypothetical protein [Flavobacterium lacisediminis]